MIELSDDARSISVIDRIDTVGFVMTGYKLIWVGPRQSDIADCEKGLFDGSITIFGKSCSRRSESEKTDSDKPDFESYAFCDDPVFSNLMRGRDSGIPCRIDHNKNTWDVDLYQLYHQIDMICHETEVKDSEIRYYFMPYCQNGLPRTGKELVYLLLADLWGYQLEPDPKKVLTLHDLFFVDFNNAFRDRQNELDIINDSEFGSSAFPRVRFNDRENPLYAKLWSMFDVLKKRLLTAIPKCGNSALLKSIGGDAEHPVMGPEFYHELADVIFSRMICVNRDADLLDELNNKLRFRSEFCKGLDIPAVEDFVIDAEDNDSTSSKCSLSYLLKNVGGRSFVLQKPISSGGHKSYYIEAPDDSVVGPVFGRMRVEDSAQPEDSRISKINDLITNWAKESGQLVVSRYRNPNVSVNVHAVVGEDDILIAPCSIQIIDRVGYKLLYAGSDYPAYAQFAKDNPECNSEIINYLTIVCKSLQGRGYRGIVGFDMIVSNSLEFVESNNRFQASTPLLNRALKEMCYLHDSDGNILTRFDGKKIKVHKRGPSLQLLNLYAFHDTYLAGKNEDPNIYKACHSLIKGVEEEVTCSGSSDQINIKDNADFPIKRNDLLSIDVPYSFVVYYNNEIAEGSKNTSDSMSHSEFIWNRIHALGERQDDYVEYYQTEDGSEDPGESKERYYKRDRTNAIGSMAKKLLELSVKNNGWKTLCMPAGDEYVLEIIKNIRDMSDTSSPEVLEQNLLSVLDILSKYENNYSNKDTSICRDPSYVAVLKQIYNIIVSNHVPIRPLKYTLSYDRDNFRELYVNKPNGEDYQHFKWNLIDHGGFLFKLMIHGNICSTHLGSVILNPNIFAPSNRWRHRTSNPKADNMLSLKVGLINNGLFIRGFIKDPVNGIVPYGGLAERLNAVGKGEFAIRKGVNSAIDMVVSCGEFRYRGEILDKLPINASCFNYISDLSPFEIVLNEASVKGTYEFKLLYYGKELAYTDDIGVQHPRRVEVYPELELDEKNGKNGLLKDRTEVTKVPTSAIALVATDRIRYQHCDHCKFARSGTGCKFCEKTIKGVDDDYEFDEADINAVITNTLNGFSNQTIGGNKKMVDHVLIGGGSMSGPEHVVKERILRMCWHIQHVYSERGNECKVPIYLMVLPPSRFEDLREYCDAGVTEVGFNIEVFDQRLSRMFMPGKCSITLSNYISALKFATRIWPEPGAVRSAMIIGLEEISSSLDGVELLASIGVSPILSIFRPIKGTELQNIMPYDSESLFNFFKKAYSICNDYGVSPGPSCMYCQNNTLALIDELVARESADNPTSGSPGV